MEKAKQQCRCAVIFLTTTQGMQTVALRLLNDVK